MLIIALTQLDEMRLRRYGEFVESLWKDTSQRFPAEIGAIRKSRNVLDVFSLWLARSRGRGLRTNQQMRRYVEMCLLMGEEALESSDICSVLDDQALSGDKKSRFIEQCLAFASRLPTRTATP